jgi:acetoin utilization deacetylase AcuC-like enzyme
MREASVPSELPIGVLDDSRFDAHHATAGLHPESPERLVAARTGLHAALGTSTSLRIEAREASDAELNRVHDARYVHDLRARLAHGSGALDADTFFSPGTREATWLAAGGAIELARSLVTNKCRRALALLRPPGHHAEFDTSMGFCLLNNVAIAASAALASGLTRVAIVDWDVHHGNGTQHMFYDDPRVLFVSLHQHPFYPGTGAAQEVGRGRGQGFTANLPLPAQSGPETYGAAFREVVLPLLRAYAPELVLVSAGFDAHARDPLANMNLDGDSYAAMTTSLLDLVDELGHGRIGFLLEGGYDLNALADSVRLTSSALLGQRRELPQGKLPARERDAINASLAQLAPFWHLSPR